MTSRRDDPTLPEPDRDALAVSARLATEIQREIAASEGALGFDRFMELALYAPGLGYYSAGARRFGAAGDFVTAPLVSPLFAQTLAREVAGCLTALGGGDVLEFGAGSGRLMVDMLRALAALDALPERYRVLEVSAALRAEQQALIKSEAPEFHDRVEWLDSLPEAPLRGVILANEVLDALPVKRFLKAGGTVEELAVTVNAAGEFDWRRRPADAALREAVADIESAQSLPDDYTSEWSPRLRGWVGALSDVLAQGVVLLIDYGYPRHEYYHPQRRMGTLMCHYRHRAHDDPFRWVGLQDITAFVDFSAVAEAGVASGLDVLGFTPQAQFLMGAGITEVVSQAAATDDVEQHYRMAQEVKALTMPGEMGERFKVMALGRDYHAPLSGFAMADHRGRL